MVYEITLEHMYIAPKNAFQICVHLLRCVATETIYTLCERAPHFACACSALYVLNIYIFGHLFYTLVRFEHTIELYKLYTLIYTLAAARRHGAEETGGVNTTRAQTVLLRHSRDLC